MKVYLQRNYEIIHFDCETKTILQSFKIPNISCYVTNEDETKLLVGTSMGLIFLIDIETGKQIWKSYGSIFGSSINSVDMSDDCNIIIYVDSHSVSYYNRTTNHSTVFDCKYGDDAALTDTHLIISDDGMIKYISLDTMKQTKTINLRRREMFDLFVYRNSVVMKSSNRIVHKKIDDISDYDTVETYNGWTWFGIKKDQCVIWDLDSLIKRTYFCPVNPLEIDDICQYGKELFYFTDEIMYTVNKITGIVNEYSIYPSVKVNPHEFSELLCCPITQEIMYDPITISDGFTYEGRAISKWMRQNLTSPITREELDPLIMVPNKIIKKIINEIKIEQTFEKK